MKSKKMWGGRFKGKTHPAFDYFSSSVAFDYKIAMFDLEASSAHCRMLQKIGILKPAESKSILRALDRIQAQLHKHEADFFARKHEDIHSYIEAELIRIAGPAAKKLHTARSRNDQVNQAVRMYCKANAKNQIRLIAHLQQSILKQATRHLDVVMPGMTHLQKAQPVLLSHLFLSYIEALERGSAQLQDALKRIDILTLGSGALAGTTIPINREAVRRELGFATTSPNSLDAVGSRDFLIEYLNVQAMVALNLSRIAEDFLIAQMDEIRWFTPPDNLCTGSSMMPQKRNPDFLELARGAAAVLNGNAATAMTLVKGLPSSYNRDLQWDKVPLFESTELLTQILYLFRIFFDGVKVNHETLKTSLAADELCATDLAEHLVQTGMAFREAHEKVGVFVLACNDKNMRLGDASDKILKDHFGPYAKRISALLDPQRSVFLKKSYGGTSPVEVERQLKRWNSKLK